MSFSERRESPLDTDGLWDLEPRRKNTTPAITSGAANNLKDLLDLAGVFRVALLVGGVVVVVLLLVVLLVMVEVVGKGLRRERRRDY